MTVCAICAELAIDPVDSRLAETTVGPLPVCGPHVTTALTKLGYVQASADIVSWLETIDPKELQNAAVELVSDYAEDATGRAFLSVLLDAAKGQSV